MFIRWKVAGKRQTASLVKSVRVEGKPRHQVIATLCSMQREQGNAANAWVKFERKMQTLDISEQERAQIYQAFELKVPRPSDETIEQEKKQLTGWETWIDNYKTNVVPHIPNVRSNEDTTGESSGSAIKWTVEQPRPKAGVDAKYTAFLVKQDGEQVKLGTIQRRDLSGNLVSYRYAFWYQVHRALCLARVDHETYEKTLQMLDTWVELPPREEFIRLMQNYQRWTENSLKSDEQAALRQLKRLTERSHDLLDVQGIGNKHLDLMRRSVPNVSL